MTSFRINLACLCFVLMALPAGAQQPAALSGTVVDPQGAAVAGAVVTLLRAGQPAGQTTSSGDGDFQFTGLAPDRYQVRVQVDGFEPRVSDAVFLDSSSRISLVVPLSIGPLRQDVVVTAAATALLESQTGAPVTVIDSETLALLNITDAAGALQLVPGISVIQTGQRGGPASVFVRGGDSDFNKVLVDGIAANDIGGAFDVGQLAVTGLDRIEVLRQSNSVLYGSDAVSGVVSLTTRRGRTRVPELTYQLEGGSLGSFSSSASLGGARRRFDYFIQGGRFHTDNDLPNSRYENNSLAGRFGVALGRATDLSGTSRWLSTDLGNPDGIRLYGIADDASLASDQLYTTIAAQSQWNSRWQSVIRFGLVDRQIEFRDASPTGEPFDPFGFGANYLGDTVTLTAANGQAVTGRAILDFGGGTYPSIFESHTTRRVLSGQASVQATPEVALSVGARYEREAALDLDGNATATRGNGGLFGEVRTALGNRVRVIAGIGWEHNEAFENAVTPRLSVVFYVREPSAGAAGDTRLVLNAGSGIKAPDLLQQENSLFGLTGGTAAGVTVDPIGPERSRSFDVGVEQGLAGGRGRVRVAYFDNHFHDLIEFVSRTTLPQVGVPAAVAAATSLGAYVNSQSFQARGVETAAEAALGALRISASYTLLDAEVRESFSGGALAPATNPAFPGVQIGAFSPLVGARPFRRPTHAGTLFVSYVRGALQLATSAYFSGARDDSTFLSDAFFGNSLLLPNEDLDPAFQKWDVSAAYQVHRRVRPYLNVENLFDREYQAVFGYPSLPLTARVGVSLTFGGD